MEGGRDKGGLMGGWGACGEEEYLRRGGEGVWGGVLGIYERYRKEKGWIYCFLIPGGGLDPCLPTAHSHLGLSIHRPLSTP